MEVEVYTVGKREGCIRTEPETIKQIFLDCNSTATVADGHVTVIDSPVAIYENF